MSTSLKGNPGQSLAARYTAHDETVLLTGIQALVRLFLEQQRLDRRRGHDSAAFISGYEGSPLGGLDLELGRRKQLLDEYAILHRPAVNEELAATAVFGSQLVPERPDARRAGVVGYWYGKAPGLDRATDAIRHANFGGAHPDGGAVALVGDDPSCKSSSVPSASDAALADLAIPTLYPGDSQEILDYGLHAVALSRATGLWAALKIVTNVADGASPVVIPEHRDAPAVPEPEPGSGPYRHHPTSQLVGARAVDCETSAYGLRMSLAREYARLNRLNVLDSHGDRDRIGMVAAGKTYFDVVTALRRLGIDDAEREKYGIRLLKLGMLFPLEPTVIDEFADGLDEIIVIEEKRSFIEAAIKDLLYGRGDAPRVLGKRDPSGAALIPQDSELSTDRLLTPLARRLVEYDGIELSQPAVSQRRAKSSLVSLPVISGDADPLPARTPYFCSGCPHSRSTQVPDGSVVGTGIGCSSMVLFMDRKRVGDVVGLTQMGGEGAQWIGMEPFVETTHLLQNIGEGTFHHSGSLAFRAAVAAKSNITYKLLYNSAVAMTGGQTAVGLRTVAELTHLLHAEGVARIIVTVDDPGRYRGVRLAHGTEVWQRERLVEAQEVLARTPGVTVLIHDQQCATEKRRQQKRNPPKKPATRVLINERVCEGCGDCGAKSNCLSVEPVETEYGRKTRINQGSCNTDLACLDGDCPSFVTVIPAGKTTRPAPAERGGATLPEPSSSVGHGDVGIRITGIGGTGVVTVAQILAQAAHLAGFYVRTLDQTGLSQKAGPVISDITLSRTETESANKLGVGECDVYLGCDLLVTADEKNLSVASASRTVGILSTSRTPTGTMITDPDAVFPDVDAVLDRVRSAMRTDAGCTIDARHLAETATDGEQYANIIMLGAAYQAGALPLPVSALEDAIRLNGVAIEQNLRAFTIGRQAALGQIPATEDPKALRARTKATGEAAEAAALVQAPAGSELARIVADRAVELVQYQSAAYARSYTALVERVRAAEAGIGAADTALSEAVARNLYKLMAYKDEYEVARLSLDPALAAQVREQFGAEASYALRFHPPVLRALGMKRKVALGRWSTPLLIGLRSARHLRGTPLDPFGLSEVRRTERQLVDEFRNVVAELAAGLTLDNRAVAVEIASLPDMVRGYEDIKLANVVRYHERLADRRAAFSAASRGAAVA